MSVTLEFPNALSTVRYRADRFHHSKERRLDIMEVYMFARKVAARLQPNSLKEFTNLMEGQILPWLRQQEGFLDLITLAAPDDIEVATISFWDRQANARAYSASGYPEVLKILEELLDGTPYVKLFEVVGSTFRGGALALRPEAGNLVGETGPAQLGYGSLDTNM